jgi:signal transduction histidine kinase
MNNAVTDSIMKNSFWRSFLSGGFIKKLFRRLTRSIELSVQYSTPKSVAIGAVGVVGFPLYFWIWGYLYPQPYENLPLRLFGSALFLPLTLASYWPVNLRRYLPVYWYGAMLFGMPFFFTFMLFKNNGSQVWLMSTLVALFLMTLLLDWLNIIVMFCAGSALAWFANWATGGIAEIPSYYAMNLPIFIFAILAGAVFTLTREIVAQEKLGTMLTAASNIAHELRTPLLGIKSGVVGLQQYLPVLVQAYQLAKENNLKVETIRAAHLDSMSAVLNRIQVEVDRSNTTIDMLLMNARLTKASQPTPMRCSMAQCIESALDRYPFASSVERGRVKWSPSVDFEFLGSDTLMVHVFFNFFKNSLHAITRARKGEIEIWLVPGVDHNEVHFKDTGPGIPALVLPQIFTRFYSWSDSSEGEPGTGVGLAFCKTVIENLGGTIHCRSVDGEFTEFVIMLPNK